MDDSFLFVAFLPQGEVSLQKFTFKKKLSVSLILPFKIVL